MIRQHAHPARAPWPCSAIATVTIAAGSGGIGAAARLLLPRLRHLGGVEESMRPSAVEIRRIAERARRRGFVAPTAAPLARCRGADLAACYPWLEAAAAMYGRWRRRWGWRKQVLNRCIASETVHALAAGAAGAAADAALQ